MLLKPMEPYGLALKEYFEGNQNAKAIFHREDGQTENHLLRLIFETKVNFLLSISKAFHYHVETC